VSRGHQVYVLTAMPNYPLGRVYPGYSSLLRKELRDGVTVFRSYVYPSQSVRMVRRLASYFSFVGSSLIAGSLLLPRVDYVLTESPPLFLGITGYLLSRLKRARWIFNVSDLWPASAVKLGVVREGAALQAASVLEGFCYRKAWLVSGQSREILSDIKNRFPQVPTYHLPNGVDTRIFYPDQRTLETRRALADGKDCIAIYAGLHGIAQGLDQVLIAARQLEDLDGLRIVLVGEGPEKARLKDQAKALGLQNVRFLDPYPRAAMPTLLASADIALVPLKQRLPGAVPSKLYEGMGAGVPVILAADGEAAEIVRETQSGMVVPPGDGAALAAALRDLAKHPDKRLQLGAHGRQAAVARFDRQGTADAFIDFLQGHDTW
jgi:glycosyltransferase involved in cell wall biosynthesis